MQMMGLCTIQYLEKKTHFTKKEHNLGKAVSENRNNAKKNIKFTYLWIFFYSVLFIQYMTQVEAFTLTCKLLTILCTLKQLMESVICWAALVLACIIHAAPAFFDWQIKTHLSFPITGSSPALLVRIHYFTFSNADILKLSYALMRFL